MDGNNRCLTEVACCLLQILCLLNRDWLSRDIRTELHVRVDARGEYLGYRIRPLLGHLEDTGALQDGANE